MTLTSMTLFSALSVALATGVALGVGWQRRRGADTGALWLLDRRGRPIPTRFHGTDEREARVDVEALRDGQAIGVGLQFADGRVVRHHFGQALPVARSDRLSIPLPRAFLPVDVADAA